MICICVLAPSAKFNWRSQWRLTRLELAHLALVCSCWYVWTLFWWLHLAKFRSEAGQDPRARKRKRDRQESSLLHLGSLGELRAPPPPPAAPVLRAPARSPFAAKGANLSGQTCAISPAFSEIFQQTAL